MTHRKQIASSTRPAYHHGDLEKALLDAAAGIIAERGVDALSVREAARRAGVSHTAVYRHYQSKAALIAAVAAFGFRRLVAEFDRIVARGGEARNHFRAIGAAYVLFAYKNPTHFRVMFGPETAQRSRFPELRTAAEALFSRIDAVIDACQAEGSVRRDESAGEIALAAWSAVHGLSDLVVNKQIAGARGRNSVAALAARTTHAVFLGFRADC